MYDPRREMRQLAATQAKKKTLRPRVRGTGAFGQQRQRPKSVVTKVTGAMVQAGKALGLTSGTTRGGGMLAAISAAAPTIIQAGKSIFQQAGGVAGVGKALGFTMPTGYRPVGVRRRRRRFRIRKGVKQRWNSKYQGWENVPRRRRAPKVKSEIDEIKTEISSLKNLIMMVGVGK